LNEDDISKLLEEYGKKYTSEWDDWAYLEDEWGRKHSPYGSPYDELSLLKDDIRAWDAHGPGYASQSTTHSGPKALDPQGESSYTEEERSKVEARWTGALVKFATHIGGNAGYPLQVSTGGSDVVEFFGTGTIFETRVNYQDRWIVQVLWANGTVTSEKIDDLVIVQPLPSA